jgi:hypothetical protein
MLGSGFLDGDETEDETEIDDLPMPWLTVL